MMDHVEREDYDYQIAYFLAARIRDFDSRFVVIMNDFVPDEESSFTITSPTSVQVVTVKTVKPRG